MKQITLHTACLNNAGVRVDGGETVAVGDKPDEIGKARAAELIKTGMAAETTAPSVSD